MSSAKDKKHLVIVGGGFGGLYTLKSIQRCSDCLENDLKITLISKENYFTFSPMLHEVATGGLDYNNVVEPIRDVIDCSVTFIQDTVKEVNLDKQTIKCSMNELNYDYLVLATGATTNYFGNENAEKYSIPLKSIIDSKNIKNQILSCFEKAANETNPKEKEKLLTFVVVGGGPTGIELVTEIAELIDDSLLHKFPTITKKDTHLVLACGNDILGPFDEISKKRAKDYMTKLDIKLVMDFVKDVEKEKVLFNKEDSVETCSIFWAAGVKPILPKMHPEIEKDKIGALIVKPTLQLNSYGNVFALGDIASGWPMLAYTATRQAKYVAMNILALIKGEKLNEFEFEPKVKLVSLGRNNALGEFLGLKLSGRLIWFLWRSVYWSKVLSFKKKAKISLNWAFNLFVSRDISKY